MWYRFLRFSHSLLEKKIFLSCLFQPNRILLEHITYRQAQPPLGGLKMLNFILSYFSFQPGMICKSTLGLTVTLLLFPFGEARLNPGSRWWNWTWPIDLRHQFPEQSIDWKKCTQTQITIVIHKRQRKILICFTFRFQIWYTRRGSSFVPIRKKYDKRIKKHQRTSWPQGRTRLDSIDQNDWAYSALVPTASGSEPLHLQPAVFPLISRTWSNLKVLWAQSIIFYPLLR